MFVLDTNAVIISSSAINVCVGLSMLAFNERRNSIREHWCFALIFFGVAGLLIGFREFFPAWLANIFSNMLIGLSVVLMHRGVWLMIGRRPPDLVYLISILILGAIYYQFTYPTPDIGIRIFFVSIFRVPYFVTAAVALRAAVPFRGLHGVKVLILLLLAGACWYLFRGCLALSSDAWAVLFRTGSLQSVNFLIAAAGNILITVALSRLEAEQAINRASQLAAQLQMQSASLETAVAARTRELELEITERIRAELALKAACDRAETALKDLLATQNTLIQAEKMASLGRLVAGAAHEINTPLGVAVTMGSLFSERIKELAASFTTGRLRRSDMEQYIGDTQEGCDLLLANLRRSADLIHSFKQIAADQVSEQRRKFNLLGCLSDTVMTLGPVWRKGGHRLDLHCPEFIEVNGYPGVISQILTNLVTNSIIHGFEPGQHGVVTVTATLFSPDLVELCYSDNGKGIEPKARDKIFEPFFTTRRSSGCTGLGLHIIYNLVVGKLKGRITLEANGGPGVRFVIGFPRWLGKDQESSAASNGS